MTGSSLPRPSSLTHRMLAAAALVLGIALAGCDQTASQYAEAQIDLEKALTVINTAERGFSADEGQQLQAYRQDALAKAIPDLKKVITSGVPEQQVAASRLHAQIDASAARLQTRRALAAYATLANETASAITYLFAVDHAQARAGSFERDLSGVIDRYNRDAQTVTTEHEELAKRARLLQSELTGVNEQIAILKAAGQAKYAEAQELNQAAFVAGGEEQYRLYDQAAALEMQANKASTEAEKLQARADAVAARLTLVQAEMNLKTKDLQTLGAQAKDAELREQTDTKNREQALAERGLAVDELMQTFNGVVQRYGEQVAEPLAAADERYVAGIGLLESARAKAGGNGSLRTEVTDDLIMMLLGRVDALTERSLAAADFAQKLGVFAADAQRLVPEHAATFSAAIDELVSSQEVIRGAALESIAQTKEIAGEDPEMITLIEQHELRLIRSEIK